LTPRPSLTRGRFYLPASQDSHLTSRREEWRKEVDSRLAMIRVTNNERAVLIRDNKTLRTTVECGRTVSHSSPFTSLFSLWQVLIGLSDGNDREVA
jgi:hypothetical protein